MTSIGGSMPCCKSELDLFYSLPTNTSIISSSYTNVQQILTGKEENFSIDIVGNDDYIDLNDIYLKLEVKICEDAELITTNSQVGPINNFAHSLFRKIDLSIGKGLQQTLVEIGSSNYGYKAYLLNLLNYGDDAKESWMQSGLFYKDKAGMFDNINISEHKTIKMTAESQVSGTEIIDLTEDLPVNPGFVSRRKQFVDGNGIIKLIIPLHLDLLHSNRFLLNHMGLFFNFEKSKDSFVLMGQSGKDWNAKIIKASIRVRKCTIHEKVKMAHINAMQISPAIYPLRQNKVYVSTMENGSMEYTISSTTSKIPNKIVCGLVLDAAYNGSFTQNPFNFQDFKLTTITLIVNNEHRVIQINKASKDFIEGFHSINESLNLYGQLGNGIKKEEYLDGNCLFCFNLNPDKGCEEQFNTLKEGSISFVLNFSENVDQKLKFIVLMEHDNQIKINNKHEILFDYNL